MNQGRPVILSQEPAPPQKTPAEKRAEVRLKLLYRKLLHAGFSPEPFIEGQEEMLPDTVKRIKRTVEILDLSIPADRQRYSDLLTSTLEKKGEVIFSEKEQFCKLTENWKVILRIDTRMFRCLTNKQETDLIVDALKDEDAMEELAQLERQQSELDQEVDKEQDVEQ